MRHDLIRYRSGEIALIYPVPAALLTGFDILYRELVRAWVELQCRTALVMDQPEAIQMLNAIASSLPHYPGLPFRVEPLKEDPDLLYTLFFSQDPPARIVQLHRFESVRPKDEQRNIEELPDEEITAKDLPFPASGDFDCDMKASLMASLGVEAADWLLKTTDAEAIDKIMYSLEVLNRPEKDRIQDYLDERYERLRQRYLEWKAGEGAEILRKRFGVGF